MITDQQLVCLLLKYDKITPEMVAEVTDIMGDRNQARRYLINTLPNWETTDTPITMLRVLNRVGLLTDTSLSD